MLLLWSVAVLLLLLLLLLITDAIVAADAVDEACVTALHSLTK